MVIVIVCACASLSLSLISGIKSASVVQVRICREKTTDHVYAMKKLKKSEMLRRGQVYIYRTF